MNTILQSCSVIGLGVGSLLGGTMLGNGKRSKIIQYNILGLAASGASLYLEFFSICVWRFIHGFATGILVNACPKMIEETVPANVMDYGFGTSTNLCINVAIMVTLLLGLGLPPESDYAETNYWMIFYGSAIPMFLLALLFNFTVFKYDSISFHAKNEEKEQCLAMISSVYSEDEKTCLIIYYYHVRLQKILAQKEAVKPDVKSTLFDPEFRSATWVCISIAVYNMMSGVNIINGYST